MRNKLHAICPYFAMFPEDFVQKHLVWAKKDDIVFDPFCGRGTTILESLLGDREVAGCDINPVAACISKAKAQIPPLAILLKRLREIENSYTRNNIAKAESEFFRYCFHHKTYGQIVHLKNSLQWNRSPVDCFLAATVLGRLHGESHRSERYLSNRMPRTISTKPAYSVKWWKENGYTAPERDAFNVVRTDLLYRAEAPRPSRRGRVRIGDVRQAHRLFPSLAKSVNLVITSPPYLDTTNFAEDQWLRLWFLGRESFSQQGRRDDRHVSLNKYWTFLADAWGGIGPLLAKKCRIIVRIGGKIDFEQADKGLRTTLGSGLSQRIKLIDKRVSNIRDGQLRSFRPNIKGTGAEYDFHFQLTG